VSEIPNPQLDFDLSAATSQRQIESQYRSIANSLPLVIWTTDPQGEVEWLSDGWYELTGLTPAESLTGRGSMRVVHPDDRLQLQQRWEMGVARRAPSEMEYRIRARNGEYRWHICRFSPVRAADGEIVRWAAASLDIHDRRMAEEQLRESERRFETVFHLIPQPTVISRVSDGAVVLVNEALVKLTGRSREQLMSTASGELDALPPAGRVVFGIGTLDSATGTTETLLHTADGRAVLMEVTCAEIDFGGERCRIAVGVDVTERRETEERLRASAAQARARADELQALMDAAPAAVWMALDAECRQIIGNRMGYDVLGIPQGGNISRTAEDPAAASRFRVFVDGVEVSDSDLAVQRAATGEEVRDWDGEVRFDDGRVLHLYGSAVPLRDPEGAPRGAIGAFVDVTLLKEAEAALMEADRRKDEFLALLSHELRNPLMPILTAAQLLKSRVEGEASRELEVITRQARHLARLVDDLIDVSRVARGKVTITRRPMELAGVLSKALEANRPLLDARNHAVTVEVPTHGLRVEADEVRLTQVFSNLLANAGRYTPPGGHVTIMATRENGEIVTRVRDTGVGIDAGLLPYVFDLFVQGARGPDRADGGLGLGLPLARTLTELHGGTVSVSSEGAGKGSEFVVRLPVAHPANIPGPRLLPVARPPTRESSNGRRILIVDDNRDVADMLALLIERIGYETRTANDPIQALEVAETMRPHIAILDIGLPMMDGYALGRELRALLGPDAPTLVALTGYSQVKDRMRSEEARFAVHLVKPVDGAQLIRLLERLFAEREEAGGTPPVPPLQ